MKTPDYTLLPQPHLRLITDGILQKKKPKAVWDAVRNCEYPDTVGSVSRNHYKEILRPKNYSIFRKYYQDRLDKIAYMNKT